MIGGDWETHTDCRRYDRHVKCKADLLAVCLVGLALPGQCSTFGAGRFTAASTRHVFTFRMLRPRRQEHLPARARDTAANAQLKFTVASIRQSTSQDKPTSNVPLTPGDSYSTLESGFTARNQPLFAYVLFAYKVQVSEAWDLLNHLPKWAVSEKYDIQAKTDLTNPTKDQIREMMRSLLQERLALRVHWKIVQRDVLALEAKKGSLGPQLRKHMADLPCTDRGSLTREQVLTAAPTQLLGKWPDLCEGDQINSAQRTRAGVRDQNMDTIAAWLTGEGDTDLPIVNRTALGGTYDLILDFAPEHGPSSPDSAFPTFAEAIPDQLGLHLKKQKGTATVFVVDHVERPSEN